MAQISDRNFAAFVATMAPLLEEIEERSRRKREAAVPEYAATGSPAITPELPPIAQPQTRSFRKVA